MTAPHPGENHEFRTTCVRCGEPGMLNVSLIAPGERVTIEARGVPDDAWPSPGYLTPQPDPTGPEHRTGE